MIESGQYYSLNSTVGVLNRLTRVRARAYSCLLRNFFVQGFAIQRLVVVCAAAFVVALRVSAGG